MMLTHYPAVYPGLRVYASEISHSFSLPSEEFAVQSCICCIGSPLIVVDFSASILLDTVAFPFDTVLVIKDRKTKNQNKTSEHISEGRERPSENAQR